GDRAAPDIHWRGVAFDRYVHGQWSRVNTSPRTMQTLEESPARDRRFLRWDGPALPAETIDELAGTLVKQDIWLEPLDSDVLFGAGQPRIVEYAHTLRPRRPPAERNDEIRLEHGSTVHYAVWSQLSPPEPDVLRKATTVLPAGYREAYLQLPNEI